jgi:hypothetical protein
MQINLKNAVSTFYSNPSFEQIYFESVANSIDAGATDISIKVSIDAFDNPQSLRIEITDNGGGFNDSNFNKFSTLMEVDSADHKGLGRLVYLHYFSRVEVTSHYGNKLRQFIYDENFDGSSTTSDLNSPNSSGTTLIFKTFSQTRVKSYNYLIPEEIKDSLIQEFFPLLYEKKKANSPLNISITLDTKIENTDKSFVNGTSTLTPNDIPNLEHDSVKNPDLDLLEKFDIHYIVQNNLKKKKSISSAICIDGRAINYDVLSDDSIPDGYQVSFMFSSEYFTGKTNASRQKLKLPDELTEGILKKFVRAQSGRILQEKIPSIKTKNDEITTSLNDTFPHLIGYYPKSNWGLINRSSYIEHAQKQFFMDQRKVLECEDLNNENYEKAIDLSSRSLMEYILHRNIIIKKLSETDLTNSETDIHQIIIPMKKTINSSTFDEDLYTNNVWLLDDKYMSYDTILSDQQMTKVIDEITGTKVNDPSRPDITLVFSDTPAPGKKVSVVVVELKKEGISLAKKEEVVSQLKQRARKLLEYYGDKIERIWFYGVTEIDTEFRLSLKESRFTELYSNGQLFYNYQPVIVSEDKDPFNVDLFVMNYKALIEDASKRNETFMKILRKRIEESKTNQSTE